MKGFMPVRLMIDFMLLYVCLLWSLSFSAKACYCGEDLTGSFHVKSHDRLVVDFCPAGQD